MNLSEWDRYDREQTLRLLKEIYDLVEARETPLEPSVWMHDKARLSEAHIEVLCSWTRSEQGRLLAESGGRKR